MDGLLICLFIFVAITIVAELHDKNKRKKEQKAKEYERFSKLYPCLFPNNEDLGKEILSSSWSLYNQAKDIIEVNEYIKWHDKEVSKRNYMIERVFAYDYEDMLFQIYAPYAEFDYYWHCKSGIRKDDIIKGILEIKKISNTEAQIIFEILVQHRLVIAVEKSDKYVLTPMLERRAFFPSWDTVTTLDMNLDKWMDNHKYHMEDENIIREKEGLLRDVINFRFNPIQNDDFTKDMLWHDKEVSKRKCIKDRVFAYDYEDMLFQIYAPTAYYNYSRWTSNSLRRDEILKRISEIKKISINDAVEIFDILLKHNLIIKRYGCDDYELTRMLENSAFLGDDYNFEEPFWFSVTVLDMNLDKWMTMHNYNNF